MVRSRTTTGSQRLAAVALLSTVVVVGVKVVTAWVSGSVSALGEALQSSADVLMSALTLVVLRVSALPQIGSTLMGTARPRFSPAHSKCC
ncbi:MAG: hypothetical protein M5U21_00515 [Fimbriimonadaceae bacterium]|nr:hypothetical protein [Fimbriimonadaceae bacterium]